MRIDRYSSEKHYEMVKGLLDLRKLPMSFLEELPQFGFCVSDDDEIPICFGFLRIIEGGSAFVDSLITNSTKESVIRHHGLNLLVDRLINSAKEMGLRRLIAYTKEDTIIHRGRSHQFKKVPQAILSLEFHGED